jgi:protein SCO1/2
MANKMKQATSTHKMIGLSLAVIVLSVSFGGAFWYWQANLQSRGGWQDKPLQGLKAFGAVPEFLLTERAGRWISLSDLTGNIWIVNFIYTNCPDTCPIQSAQMKQLQDDFTSEKELRLVSITVDPERDTPEVLTKYAARFGADPARWFFLTGEKEAIYKLAQGGFRLGAVEIPHEKRPESGATHTHSPRFVLVDREAEIRGYSVSTDPEDMKRLRDDLKKVLRGEA